MISVVTLHWKRSANTDQIVNSLQKSSLVDEVIVWNNNKEVPFRSKHGEKVINTSVDFGLNTRFVAATLAKNDVILTIDDDNLIPEDTIKKLYGVWKTEPEILHSLDGRKPDENNKYAVDVMLGHNLPMVEAPICMTRCTIYKKEYALLYLQLEAKIREDLKHTIIGNGEDIILSYIARNVANGKLHKIYRFSRKNLPAPYSIHHVVGHKMFRTLLMQRCQNYFNLK